MTLQRKTYLGRLSQALTGSRSEGTGGLQQSGGEAQDSPPRGGVAPAPTHTPAVLHDLAPLGRAGLGEAVGATGSGLPFPCQGRLPLRDTAVGLS